MVQFDYNHFSCYPAHLQEHATEAAEEGWEPYLMCSAPDGGETRLHVLLRRPQAIPEPFAIEWVREED